MNRGVLILVVRKTSCQSSLVDMYHNVEALEDAPRVFNKMRSCNVGIWAE